MIIDVHRHMVANGTAQGDPIRGAQKTFAMMYRKVHNVEISDRDFREKVVRDGCKKKKMINWFSAPIWLIQFCKIYAHLGWGSFGIKDGFCRLS